jgi:hypothetical protein
MTIYPFVPSSQAPPQFQITLDGQDYTMVVIWGLFGQRYYIALYSLAGTRIFTMPLVSSPVGIAVQSLAWSEGLVTVTTQLPHGYEIGSVLFLTVSGASPTGYNGVWEMAVTSPTTLTFTLADFPGAAVIGGNLSFDINLAGGYFQSSTLVFRGQSAQFEVNP